MTDPALAPDSAPDAVRAAWAAGRAARNGWLTVPDPHLVEVVAAHAAGRGLLDAVTLDLQHGLFDRARSADAVRAIAAHGLAPLVRLPAVDEATVGFVLDLGVRGVIAPMVSDAAAARELVAACRYPPVGRRSFGPVRTALRPGDDPVAAADTVLALAMVETADALDRADEIAAVPGLDGLFVGPGDLGVALGIGAAQDREEPAIHDAFRRVLAACAAAGTRAAVHATRPEYAAARAADGFALVTVWSDVPAILGSLDGVRAAFEA
ncbi:HpcH/HpaI aldolase family protein [Actinomycetospora lemnae]|uniref:Aldolase/citrate lyase family protein n=1 Tax=Actinomycetospora lemnae TaxID=3019891 RepID=A0ABT5T219_9PSEU|nr:aldolase/citrate lyase family protein [Actinomycetospora sp. DW7H6]MDD7968750.1 aldolase/citrate lyase family protein [Actinomycetospora sp. DW7H6]